MVENTVKLRFDVTIFDEHSNNILSIIEKYATVTTLSMEKIDEAGPDTAENVCKIVKFVPVEMKTIIMKELTKLNPNGIIA